MKLALITGASSGLGKEAAYLLAKKGYHLIIVARRESLLNDLKHDIEKKTSVTVAVHACDLIIETQRNKLLDSLSISKIDVFINNAGFGHVAHFLETNLDVDSSMIDLNIKAWHHLFSHYYAQMAQTGGYILNVSSAAAFQPGPKMACYYGTKAFILSVSRAARFEAKKLKLPVSVSTLCPGPVATEFQQVATMASLPGMSSEKCMKKGINGMFKKRDVITPGISISIARIFSKVLPHRFVMPFIYNIQKKR